MTSQALETGFKMFFELEYDTWGSFGQYDLSYLILSNDKRIDPRKLANRVRKGTTVKSELNMDGFRVIVEIENNSSRKNSHYTVRVLGIEPTPEYVIYVGERRTSGNFYRDVKIYRDGKEYKAELLKEIRDVTKENGRYIYHYREHITYVQVGNRKHVIDVEKEFVGKDIIGKPHVTIVITDARIEATGDTYHVKDVLKSLGFRWNGLEKVWYKEETGENVVNMVVEKLKEIADVEVKKAWWLR